MDIEICSKCEGTGIYLRHTTREWEPETCPLCNGTGRLYTRNYTLRLPFDNDFDWVIANSVSNQIMKLIDSVKNIHKIKNER